MTDPIKDLFSAVKSSGIFLDEQDLREQLGKSPKDVYSLVSKYQPTSSLFLDYGDFETAMALKKKPGGAESSSEAPSTSQPKPTNFWQPQYENSITTVPKAPSFIKPITAQAVKKSIQQPQSEDPLGDIEQGLLDTSGNLLHRRNELNKAYGNRDATAVKINLPYETDASRHVTELNQQEAEVTQEYNKLQKIVKKTGLPISEAETRQQLSKWVTDVNIDAVPIEVLAKKIPQTTTAKAYLKTFENFQDFDNAISSVPTIEQAALKWKEWQLVKDGSENAKLEYEAIRKLGDEMSNPNRIPDAKMGAILSEFLQQPAAMEWSKKSQQNNVIYQQASQNLLQHYPSFGKGVIATKIANAREEQGLNNGFVNFTSEGGNDEIVKALVERGDMTPQEKFFYDKYKGEINSQVKTPGFLNAIGRGYIHGMKNMAGTIEDVTGVLPSDQVLHNKVQRESSESGLKVEGIHNFVNLMGEFTGQVLPIAIVSKNLTTLGVNPTVANAAAVGLAFEHPNREDAVYMFPHDKTKQVLYTSLKTALDMGLGVMYERSKILDGIMKDSKPAVRALVSDLTEGNISEAAARQGIEKLTTNYVEKAASLGAKALQHNLKQSVQMTGFTMGKDILDQVFGGRDVSLDEFTSNAGESIYSAFMSGGFLSLMAAHGEMPASLTGRKIMDIAERPQFYKDAVSRDQSLTTEQKQERLQNIEHAVSILEDLNNETALTPKQKETVLLHELNHKALQDKLNKTTAISVKERIREQMKASTEAVKNVFKETEGPQENEAETNPETELVQANEPTVQPEKKGVAVVLPSEPISQQIITIAPKEVIKAETGGKGAKVVLPQSNAAPRVVGSSNPLQENVSRETSEVSRLGVSEEQKTADLQEAQSYGFVDVHEAMGSVKKRTGIEYPTFQQIPKDILKQVAEERTSEKQGQADEIVDNLDPHGEDTSNHSTEDRSRPQAEGTLGSGASKPEERGITEDLRKYDTAGGPEAKGTEKVTGATEDQGLATGIKKSVVEEEQGKLNVEGTNFHRLSDEQIIEEGRRLVESKEVDPRSIAQQIATGKPRPLSSTETVAMVYYKAQLENEILAVTKKINAAIKAGDDAQELVLREQLQSLESDRKDFFVMSGKTGYEQSASFRLRKLMLDSEYNAVYHEMKYRAANGGKIPDTVLEKFKKLEQEYKDLQQRMKELEEQKSDKAFETFVKKENTDLQKRRAERTQKQEAIDSRIGAITTSIREKLRAQRSQLNSNPVPVEIIPDLVALTREYIRKGIVSAEEIIDTMYTELKEDLEGISKRDLRDAISGYGRIKQPSKDAIEAGLHEAKRQMQLLSALEDAEGGQPPLRTGFQRPKPSDRVRELQQKVNQSIRDNDIQVKDPEQQLKSALGGVKTRLRNSIADLERRLQTGEKSPKKTGITYDEEANHLKEIRDSLRRQVEALEGKPEFSDEQRVKLATTMLERSIEDYQRRINEKEFSRSEGKTPETPELTELKKTRDALRQEYEKLKEAEGITEQQKRAAYRKQLEKRIAEYERRLSAGDFSKPVKPELPLSEAEIKLKAKFNDIRRQFEEEHIKLKKAQRPRWEKILDGIAHLKRELVISSVLTLGKLASAGTLRQVQTPWENLNGQILHLLLPGLSRKAPVEGGGWNTAAELVAQKKFLSTWGQFFTGKGSMWEVIKTGTSDLDKAFGETHLPEEMVSYIGRSHGALKDPVKQAEFIRALKIQATNAVREGVDISDPVVLKVMTDKAYLKGRSAIFMNENLATRAYRSMLSFMEREGGKKGKVAATLAKLELPVISVPTNFVNEIAKLGAGSVHASVKALEVLFTTGFKNMTPEAADYIMSALKKQGIGAAMYMMGYLGYMAAGGYYNGKRKENDLEPADLIIFGVSIPHFLTHSPMLEPIQMGATTRRAEEAYHKKGEEGGTVEGMRQAALGAIKQVPLIETPKRLYDAFSQKEGITGHLGELVKSNVIPPDVQKIARAMDTDEKGEMIKRKPHGFVESIEAGVPGLRKDVSESEPPQLKARREIRQLLKSGKQYNEVPEALKKKAQISPLSLTQFIYDAHLEDDVLEFKNLKVAAQLNTWSKLSKEDKLRFARYAHKMATINKYLEGTGEKKKYEKVLEEIREYRRKAQ